MFGEDINANSPPLPETWRALCQWFPRSLALIFGAKPTKPAAGSTGATDQPQCQCCQTAWTQELLLMELLAQEAEDEIPDNGALAGSSDEYEGF